jgi:hypothetical protein
MTAAHSQTMPENDPVPPQPETTHPPETAPEPDPMLDVHPPHHAASTWRDFLIHIATIVLGLLIAIGLEQTVEYCHHRHQLKEIRQELSAERDENRAILQKNLEAVKTIQAQLDRNMALLREHQRSHVPLAGKLAYSSNLYRTPDAVWQSALQGGALGLMPHDELRANVYLYEVFTSFMEAVHAFYTQAEIAEAITHRSPDGSLSTRDTEELITATSETQGKLAYAAKFLSYEAIGLQKAGH